MANVEGVFIALDLKNGNTYPIKGTTNCKVTVTPIPNNGGATFTITFDNTSGNYLPQVDEVVMQNACKTSNLLFLQSAGGVVSQANDLSGNAVAIMEGDPSGNVATINLSFSLAAGKVNNYLGQNINPPDPPIHHHGH